MNWLYTGSPPFHRSHRSTRNSPEGSKDAAAELAAQKKSRRIECDRRDSNGNKPMDTFYSPEGPVNQALEAEFSFIFTVLRPKVKLRKSERKALEALKSGIVMIDDICPDNAAQHGLAAFDDFTIKWAIRSADVIIVCPTDDPVHLSAQFAPEPIRAAAIAGHKVLVIGTIDGQYENWMRLVMRWHRPSATVVTMVGPGRKGDRTQETGSKPSEAPPPSGGRA
jgi:hypothetical protein